MSLTVEECSSEPQEGWVRVRRRKGRRTGGGAVTAPASSIFSSAPVPSTPSLTLEQIKQNHDRFSDQWKSSPSCCRLQELLSSHTTGTRKVTKAICFGLGTFDPADGSWEQKRKAHVQLTSFLTIVEHVQSKEKEHQVLCFFQDPIFNSVDKAFIASLGHQVVESPKGFQLVDPSTLVFGVHLYRDIYSEVIATHIPAMFIGTAYEVWEDFHGTENLDWARMKELDQLCDKVKFPENKADTTFSSTTIHWRQRDHS
ncbi:hypothetical protein HD806DRAFT_302818 [Xylariaceae sp. AK1471]|nr:hypothetical protein HD806DRAFT_302818 [Xylariaceae sp. AK1471]